MKIQSGKALAFIPASHEDPKNPGSLKKVLFNADDLIAGGIVQMINWALLPSGKHFALHYHEDMEEIFIIINGKAKITVDSLSVEIEAGDAVHIPMRAKHTMENTGGQDVHYIAIGISLGSGGKTVVVS